MTYPVVNLSFVIERIGAKLDLRSVIAQRYGKPLVPRGERWSCECFLPSTVDGFAGSCAEQDAATSGGDRPTNLWVSVGERTLVWRCHSCGRHGDVVDLIGYADGIPRAGVRVGLGAVRRAAELVGLGWVMDGEPGPRVGRDRQDVDLVLAQPVQPTVSTPSRGASVPLDRAYALLAQVCEFYRKQLVTDSPDAVRARLLLAARGVHREQIDALGLGLAAGVADRLVAFIRARDQTGEWLELARRLGLVRRACSCKLRDCDGSHPGAELRWYDAQRERVVFPYMERDVDTLQWRVTGFAGRSLLDNLGVGEPSPPLPANVAKWLNSDNSDAWSKRSALLGLASFVPGETRCVVSEGGFDLAIWQRAEVQAVAPVGVGFTIEHATVLQRHGIRAVTLCLDPDASGRQAVLPALGHLLAAGFAWDDLHVIDLPDDHDPDEVSVDTLQRHYDAPLTPVEFVERHAEMLREHAGRYASAVALVPGDDRARLRTLLALAETKPEAVESTLGQALVRELLAHPDASAHVSADDVRKVLVNEPHLHDALAHLHFGESTSTELAPSIARLLLTHERAELRAHLDTLEAACEWTDDAVAEQDAVADRIYEVENRLRAIGLGATLQAQ